MTIFAKAAATFFVSWPLLYDILVRRLRLGKIGWKRVDYVWLGLTAVSVFGAVSRAETVASGLEQSQLATWANSTYEMVRVFSGTYS